MKILLIDDEIETLEMFALRLEVSGFTVVKANGGKEGLKLANSVHPDLIFLDLRMPEMNGFQVYEALKKEPSTADIPVIILTCQDDLSSKIKGLESGIDDYIIKDEVDMRELAVRAKSVIMKAKERLEANPLTHLPGNFRIEQVINENLSDKNPFVVGYIDIDNFKPFNDNFGFSTGDTLISGLSTILKRLKTKYDSFVGHIGGDDFIFVSNNLDSAKHMSIEIIKGMVALRTVCGTDKGFSARDRDGNIRDFPPISASVAIISIENFSESSMELISKKAMLLKKMIKERGGNTFAIHKI